MSNPTALPIDHTLYKIQDTILICEPKGSSVARFQRISFTGTEKLPQRPRANAHDPIDLGPFDDIIAVRAITDYAGRQSVALLTKTTIPSVATVSMVAMKDGTAHLTPITAANGGVGLPALVIGFHPTQKEESLFLLESDPQARLVLVKMNSLTGQRVRECRLPDKVSGTPVAAELVRHRSECVLMIVALDHGSLSVHTVAWESVDPSGLRDVSGEPAVPPLWVNEKDVVTASLGTVSADPSARVAAAVTSMQVGSANQQLAIAWSDSTSTAAIALIGWEEATATAAGATAPSAAFGAKVLAKETPQVSFAPPRAPVYRLAAADLLQAGAEQLVLGYPATYGSCPGCAALMLYTLDETDVRNRKLNCVSKYSVSNTDRQPWATTDLYIGAGVFGTCMGVQVIGGGASMGDLLKGRASVLCGFVPVDPNRRGFPPMTGDVPGVPAICVGPSGKGNALAALDPNAPRFIAFPGDPAGQSVRLGEPKHHQVNVCNQILAVIQAPPYDLNVTNTQPTLLYSKTNSEGSGCSVSSDKSYVLSKDFGANIQIGGLSLSKNIVDTWTKSFNEAQENNKTTDLTLSVTADAHDVLLVSGMSYDVWRYPVLALSGGDADNEILVVVPTAAAPQIQPFPGYHPSYGYRPRSEVGMLLSYVGVDKDGLSDANRVFEPDGVSVSESPAGTSTSGAQMTSTSNVVGKHFSVSNSISSSAHFTEQTALFDFLPVSFGLNISQHETFGNGSVNTTHINFTENMHWSLNSGSVKESVYSYNIIPCIYVHDKLGFLVISWDVDLSAGANYDPRSNISDLRKLDDPDVCVVRVDPFSKDNQQKWYSRSIRFHDQDPDKLTIEVEIFNNSIVEAKLVKCELFGPQSELNLDPRGNAVHVETVPRIDACGRSTLSFTVKRPKKTPCYFTVRVSCEVPFKPKTYWNSYPAQKYGGHGPT